MTAHKIHDLFMMFHNGIWSNHIAKKYLSLKYQIKRTINQKNIYVDFAMNSKFSIVDYI